MTGTSSSQASRAAAGGFRAAVSSHNESLQPRSAVMKRTKLFAALLIVSALSFVSCTSGDDGPNGPTPEEPSSALLGSSGGGLLDTGIGTGLLACNPLPYAKTTQTVGTAGGILIVGPHR